MSGGRSPLVIGSRGSKLALWQANWVKGRLAASGHAARIEEIRTSGDRQQDRSLVDIGGKGVFVKEIEEALLAGRIDLAVHSLKDLPTAQPDGLTIGTFNTGLIYAQLLGRKGIKFDLTQLEILGKAAADPRVPHHSGGPNLYARG